MNIHVSILGAAAIIAAAILFSMRWEIATGSSAAFRLDRWTGAVDVCWAYQAASGSHGREYRARCELPSQTFDPTTAVPVKAR